MPTISGVARNRYLELVRQYPLTRVANDRELKAAQGVMDQLLAHGNLTKGELTYLDALSELVVAYENVLHPVPSPSDAAMLQHLMEAKGINQKQLHDATNIPLSTISKILSGKRTFTKRIVNALSVYFAVEKGLLAANSRPRAR
jgi:HTH-type transcriptional regulator/antitoxin HigA